MAQQLEARRRGGGGGRHPQSHGHRGGMVQRAEREHPVAVRWPTPCYAVWLAAKQPGLGWTWGPEQMECPFREDKELLIASPEGVTGMPEVLLHPASDIEPASRAAEAHGCPLRGSRNCEIRTRHGVTAATAS